VINAFTSEFGTHRKVHPSLCQWNFLAEGRISVFRKRNTKKLQWFTVCIPFVCRKCKWTNGVLLHKGKRKPAVPVAQAGAMTERFESMSHVLNAIKYKEN
jgi:hypothetical protein